MFTSMAISQGFDGLYNMFVSFTMDSDPNGFVGEPAKVGTERGRQATARRSA